MEPRNLLLNFLSVHFLSEKVRTKNGVTKNERGRTTFTIPTMPPNRPLTPTSLPHLEVMLTDDGSRTLRDKLLDETFHSGCGALSECWYVYLLNSGIHDKLAARTATPVRVLELGFGTGMGWLITAAAAEAHAAALEYVSLEKELLPADVLAQIDTATATDRAISDGWIPTSFSALRSIETTWLRHRQTLSTDGDIEHQVSPTNRLRLILGDAQEWLRLASVQTFDAIYFDAFSPSTNPELWHEEMFGQVKKLLRPDGKLVSYCVNGAVRRALQSAGFNVQRLPGPPGGKREVLVAIQ